MSIKGYKVISPNWTCRGFKYEVGKTYKHNGNISLCNAGFHFCRNASDCFDYCSFDCNNHVVEVEALGLVESDDTKSVTDEIRIVREIEWAELLNLVNEGKNCTGLRNSGDWNSGNWNSGNWNSGNRNSGSFCTDTPKVRAFNVQTDISREEWGKIKGVRVLCWNYENNWWIYSQNMSEEEKQKHPEHQYTGGYLKTVSFKEACAIMWKRLDYDEKQAVRDIPYFDAAIFKEITGIDVDKE